MISIPRLAAGMGYSKSLSWTARGSNAGAGDIFRAVNIGPEADSASCTVGIGLFLRRKTAEA